MGRASPKVHRELRATLSARAACPAKAQGNSEGFTGFEWILSSQEMRVLGRLARPLGAGGQARACILEAPDERFSLQGNLHLAAQNSGGVVGDHQAKLWLRTRMRELFKFLKY